MLPHRSSPQVTDKEMVHCDSCAKWVHAECDPEAARLMANPADEGGLGVGACACD